ncbi:MAG: AAA family ATPase [Caldilineaceae bacterium]
MAFKKMQKIQYPPRQWALVGYPGSGKSTFAAQMAGPLLVVDADHRFAEVARFASDEVFQLSDEPADNVNAERIAALLKENMSGSGVKTVVIDSLTSILSPLIVEAILDNDAGRNKNRVASFKDKALAMRLLQDTVTGWGVDTLWIYHLRTGLDGQAREVESTTISVVELARLRRSLNLQLRLVEEQNRHGVYVEWARRGRSAPTGLPILWDESGSWQGMPAKIEAAVYGGLTAEEMLALEEYPPVAFSGPEDAIAWGVEQGCFRDTVHAKNAYDKIKREKRPQTAPDMWQWWIEEVEQRKQTVVEELEL